MKRRGLMATLVIIGMFAIIAAYVFFSYGRIKPDADKICAGIKVDSIEIGGMTREEAAAAVNTHVTKLGNRTITLNVNGQSAICSLNEAGYTYSAGEFLEQAMKVGKEGNLLENYRQIQAAAQGEVSFKVTSSLDEKVLKQFVKDCKKKMCSGAKNAGIKMENGEFVYTKSKEGVSIDVDETLQMIKGAVEATKSDTANIVVDANMKVEQPQVTQETAAKCKDKIGTFSTTFNAGNANRTKNLANAARLISGSVVYPGETFSVHDTISPLTEENGYYAAASYNNGKVEDSLGGGVCQVSTTLYNAVLKAELEIVERSPHSMVVSYVKPAMDAAIAGDYKDFKFKNNTSVPIYIQGGTYGSTIYFNIYGEETRSADRQVRFESEIIETIQPGKDKVTLDKTQPESYEKVTQAAHIGYKARLWKIVTENGEETKTQVNVSTYAAAPRYVTKGSKKEEKKETDKTEGSKKSNSSNDTRSTDDSQNADSSETTVDATPAPANTGADATTTQSTPSEQVTPAEGTETVQ